MNLQPSIYQQVSQMLAEKSFPTVIQAYKHIYLEGDDLMVIRLVQIIVCSGQNAMGL